MVEISFCSSCGKEVPSGSVFCPHCGARVAVPKAAPLRPRPTGVSILAALQVLASLLSFMAATLIAAAAYYIPIFGILFMTLSLILVIIGLIGFIIAWGLWVGKGWAWMLTLIFAIIGIFFGLISLPSGIIGILINVLIIYYLTRPHVKEFFGRAPPPPPPPPPP